MNKPLFGPTIENITVGSWCPTPDGSGKPTAVAITLTTKNLGDLVVRIKSPERVDEIVKLLLMYKNQVWQNPIDGSHKHSTLNN